MNKWSEETIEEEGAKPNDGQIQQMTKSKTQNRFKISQVRLIRFRICAKNS